MKWKVLLSALLVAMLLLTGCGRNSQPSGPPPLTYATSTTGTSTPGSANAGKTLQILRFPGSVDALAWSPDGTRLAIANSGNMGEVFQVWDATTGKLVSTYNGQFASACCLAWSPDGKRIVSAGAVSVDADPHHLRIWDAATGNTLISLVSDSQNKSNGVQALAWLPNSSHIAALIQTGPTRTPSTPTPPQKEELQIWDAAAGTLLSTYPVSIQAFNAVTSPDGKEIAIGNRDGTVQIWDVATGERLLTYQGHNSTPLAIAWSPTGKAIASASGEPEVQVWDPTTGKEFFHYQGHVGNVAALAWSPDGTRIVSGSQSAGGITEDHPIQVWDAFTGQHPFYYTGQSESVRALGWSPDGTEIASAGSATVQIWQAPPDG